MARSSYVEESQIVAQALPDVPRFEPLAIVLALVAFLAASAVGLILYLTKGQIDHRIVEWTIGAVIVAGFVAFFRITPASRLTPVERMIRSKRQAFALLGLLTGAALLGSIATASELDTALDWFMLAFIAGSPISVFFLINVRFGMG